MSIFAQAWDLLVKALDPNNFNLDDLIGREAFPKNDRSALHYIMRDPQGKREFAKLRSKKIDADLDMTGRDIAPFSASKWSGKEEARDALGGGYSSPGKMINQTYSLPTHMCKVGGRLREVPGSVCHNCYAHPADGSSQGYTYAMNNVQRHLLRNYDALKRDPHRWASALASKQYGINSVAPRDGLFPEFRWHDSGDADSPEHLALMAAIADSNPDIFNWLPTREWESTRKLMNARSTLPPNMAMRLSIPHIDQTLDNDLNEQRGVPLMEQKYLDMLEEFPQLLTTGVVSDKKLARNRDDICLVSDKSQGKKTCMDAQCDACYKPSVPNVDFVVH